MQRAQRRSGKNMPACTPESPGKTPQPGEWHMLGVSCSAESQQLHSPLQNAAQTKWCCPPIQNSLVLERILFYFNLITCIGFFGGDYKNPCLIQNTSKIQKKTKKENRNTNCFTSQGKPMLISKHPLLGFVVVVVKFAYSLPIFPLGLVSFSHLTVEALYV